MLSAVCDVRVGWLFTRSNSTVGNGVLLFTKTARSLAHRPGVHPGEGPVGRALSPPLFVRVCMDRDLKNLVFRGDIRM